MHVVGKAEQEKKMRKPGYIKNIRGISKWLYYSHLEYPSDILEGVVSGWSLQKRFHLQTQKLQKRFHLQTQKLEEDLFEVQPLCSQTPGKWKCQMKVSDMTMAGVNIPTRKC